MRIDEFEARTGYYPSGIEYACIEKAYMNFDGDKDAFCAAYKANTEEIASHIQNYVNLKMNLLFLRHQAEIEKKNDEINQLKAQLEREEEWVPCEDRSAFGQADYESLRQTPTTKTLSDEDAKALISDWFGFDEEKVEIEHSAPVLERNRHRQLRKVGEKECSPLYNSTDWYYIRFTCCARCYEATNDSLNVID